MKPNRGDLCELAVRDGAAALAALTDTLARLQAFPDFAADGDQSSAQSRDLTAANAPIHRSTPGSTAVRETGRSHCDQVAYQRGDDEDIQLDAGGSSLFERQPAADSEQAERTRLMDYALRQLARREHAAVELRRKLMARARGGELMVRQVIEDLTADGSLSDERFASEYARSRIRKGYGPLRIRMELLEKGVSDRLADEALAVPEAYWEQQAAAACEKKYGTSVCGDDAALGQRMARFLSQRGYPADLIYRALDGRLCEA
ncbi:MAG: regulatory protein RecX [Pseudomonadota bacterium]